MTASPGRRANALDAAVAAAPESPGVYVFLGEDLELLYVGKAANLRRRVRQHARASPNEADRRVAALYGSTREVRWMLCPTETAAVALEADLIVSLQPTFNAAHAAGGRWTLVVVGGAGPGSDHVRFELVADDGGGRGGGRRQAGRQVYGCFPAPASPPGRASPAATATPPSFDSCGRQARRPRTAAWSHDGWRAGHLPRRSTCRCRRGCPAGSTSSCQAAAVGCWKGWPLPVRPTAI